MKLAVSSAKPHPDDITNASNRSNAAPIREDYIRSLKIIKPDDSMPSVARPLRRGRTQLQLRLNWTLKPESGGQSSVQSTLEAFRWLYRKRGQEIQNTKLGHTHLEILLSGM